MMMHNVNINQV